MSIYIICLNKYGGIMFSFIKEMLICPACHGELIWEIINENKTHIIEAEIKCQKCNNEYVVKNGVGCFVKYEKSFDDGWQNAENWLTNLLAENPDIMEKLMVADIEEMNAADIMVRGIICRKEGNVAEATKLSEISIKKRYKEEQTKALFGQLDYVVNSLKDEKNIILDVASGLGDLVQKLLENTDVCIISSDISFHVMEKAKKSTEEKGYGDRVSYIAFDLNKSPFRNKSIKIITTFFGLQNIVSPVRIFNEIRRICDGKLYSICNFCCDENSKNIKVLEEDGSAEMWLKNKYINEFDKVGFTSVVENSIITFNELTLVGKIAKGVTIDNFPVEPGDFEYAVVISS